MKKEREALLAKAETQVRAAESAKRNMSDDEAKIADEALAAVAALNPQIKRIEELNTLRAHFPTGRVLVDGPKHNPSVNGRRRFARSAKANGSHLPLLTADYAGDFAAWLESRCRTVGENMREGADIDGGFLVPNMEAALVEGTTTAGGFAVPSQVEGQIVPLAPPEMGVYKLATVIPTTMDLKFPRKTAHGTAAAKAEAAAFGGADPTIDQFTLTANMVGHIEDASWELLQDVPAFQAFLTDDILLSIAILKEGYFCTGNGSGQPQGLIGNTGLGTGVPIEPDSNGNLVTINSTFDVMGTLNAIYHPGASWLMTRATSIIVRKAQTQSNLFAPVFTREGGQDYLHGYPVEYSSSMPSAARGNTPVLFGDFKRGYIIGERGGAGVNVKILDQTKAANGLLEVLGYQRVDGRVRRSEAIQQIAIALS